MPDLVTFGETPLRLTPPEHRRLARTDRVDLHVDGAESNVAVAANCLGVNATWISKLPESPASRRVLSEIHRHGVDTISRSSDGGRVGLVYHEAGADPRPDGRWHDRTDTSAARMSPADLPMDRVQSTDVVFSGIATPALSEGAAETTQALLRAGSGAGATAALDVDYDPRRHDPAAIRTLFEGLLEYVQVCFVSEEDARAVLAVSGQARELANTIVAEYDIDTVVITRSEHGAVLMRDTPGTKVVHERDAVESHTIDPSGTHEAFVGAFLARLAAAAEPADALSYGVAAASIARTEPGPLLSATPAELEPLAERVADEG
ncbi:MAG: PfkB family carbohydrate kinase [Haloplanus sp.]